MRWITTAVMMRTSKWKVKGLLEQRAPQLPATSVPARQLQSTQDETAAPVGEPPSPAGSSVDGGGASGSWWGAPYAQFSP